MNKEELDKILLQVEDILIVKGYNEALKYFRKNVPNNPFMWYNEILKSIENNL